MRRKIKIAISCIITVSLTVFFLSSLTDLMERKSNKAKHADFFHKMKILMCCSWALVML